MSEANKGAIHSDATEAEDHGEVDFDGADAFLKNLTAADDERKRPSKGEPEAGEETPEEDHRSEETEEEVEEAEEGTEKPKADKSAVELGDDTTVKVKVNGEETEITLGDLKRLAGQEKALTQKSMEVAEARKAFEAKANHAAAVLQKQLERAQERFKPYEGLDYLKLSRTLPEDQWDQLRRDALEAQQNVQFVQQELMGVQQAVNETRQAEMAKAAQEAVAVLQGPEDKGGIAGWNQNLYNDIMGYAVTAGVPKEMAYSIVNPAAIRMMHKAMLFDRGKTAATTQIVKAKAAPAKVAKPGAVAQQGSSSKADDARARLARTGSDDDAMGAFLASLRG